MKTRIRIAMVQLVARLTSISYLLGQIDRPLVMGILNVTPDSFSDGGKYLKRESALRHAEKMISEGADIIDIGGESTRPGAKAVSVAEELDRVVPLVEQLRALSDIPISVDTSTADVITAASAVGASLINDVRALNKEGALQAAVASKLPVCLVHMQGKPETMQNKPVYTDLFNEIIGFFGQRIAACEAAGIPSDQIIVDPGFGFGKTAQHNLAIINRLEEFKVLGKSLLVGLSRKSTLAAIVEGERIIGSVAGASVAGAMVAVANGASIVRVHDVAETVEALRVQSAIKTEGKYL